MKTQLAILSGAMVVAVLGTGCATHCVEGPDGTTCTAKSLKRFDGAVSPTQAVQRAPGAPVTIDVQYGNVLVTRSNSDQVEVTFRPFCYAGYDEQTAAQQYMAGSLRTTATAEGGVTVVVARAGGTNGLGADAIVGLPDGFDGTLTVLNRGDGPLNEFDLKVNHVGRATAVSLTNQSQLGGCWLGGAPTVRSTTVACNETISVFDVSDDVSITNGDAHHDARSPAITLRMAAASPNSRGGSITSASGSVVATFPVAGGFTIDARSPVQGNVQEGALPTVCQVEAASASAKIVRCGAGPTYQIVAGSGPSGLARNQSHDVVLSYQ
jgi:hypothetical protein